MNQHTQERPLLADTLPAFADEFRQLLAEQGEPELAAQVAGLMNVSRLTLTNDIRPAAVGRRRWLFIGHPDAGWRSAVIYSILGSCRRRGLNPHEYLTDVLGRLPSTKITQIHELLPTHWKPQSADTT